MRFDALLKLGPWLIGIPILLFLFYVIHRIKNKSRKNGLVKRGKGKKVLLTIVISLLLVMSILIGGILCYVDYYAKGVFSQLDHDDIDKSDKSLGINQTTTTEVYPYEEETSESTVKTTTEETTTIMTSKSEITPTVAPIPVDINNLPKCETAKVMIFGINQGLADSMKIASVNKTLDVTDIASIERDIKIRYQGKDYKINELYSKLGSLNFLKVFNEIFHTDIRDYVVINYDSFIKTVDLIGGVEVDVKEKDRNEINKCIQWQCSSSGLNYQDYKIETAGVQVLNGVQALGFARARKQDSDIGRSQRQDIIIQAVLKKVRLLSFNQLNNLINQVAPYIKTTLDLETTLNLVWDSLVGGYSIQTQIFPTMKEIYKEGMIENIQGETRWYIEVNLELMSRNLNFFLNYNIK